MQKQLLWHNFQEKNKQLEMQHKIQLEHKYQVRVLFYMFSIQHTFVFFFINKSNLPIFDFPFLGFFG